MRIFNSKKAQSTAEYAIIIAVVVGALVATQIYIKRGLQGRLKDVVDVSNTTVTTAASWSGLYGNGTTGTPKAATEAPQWEFEQATSQNTRDLNSKNVETLAKGSKGEAADGQVSRSVEETTKAAAGDFRKISY